MCALVCGLSPCWHWYDADIRPTIASSNMPNNIFCTSHSWLWLSGFQDILGCTSAELSSKFLISKDKILKIQSPAALWCHLLFHGFKSRRESCIRSRGRVERKKMFAMFEAVVGLSGVQACFSPSLIHCHETVWRQARGSCRLIHWEFDQKPRTTSMKTGWQIAAVPYQINLVSSDVVKWNYNKHWGMFFFFFLRRNWAHFGFLYH